MSFMKNGQSSVCFACSLKTCSDAIKIYYWGHFRVTELQKLILVILIIMLLRLFFCDICGNSFLLSSGLVIRLGIRVGEKNKIDGNVYKNRRTQ